MLEELDRAALYASNVGLAHPALDAFFVTLAESKLILVPVALVLALAAWRGGPRARIAIVVALGCLAITDPSTHYLLKPAFARLRPCHALSDLHLVVACGGRYGFPSNHAVNIAALATVLVSFYRRFLVPALFFTILVCFSRVYLAKHYLSDVVAGALWGVVVGLIVVFLARKILETWPQGGRWKHHLQD